MFLLLPNINSYSNKINAWLVPWEHKSQHIPFMCWGIHLETLRPPCPFVSCQEGSCCSQSQLQTEQQGHSETCWGVEPWWEAQEHSLLAGSQPLPESYPSSKHLLPHVPVHSHTGTFITCRQQSWAKIRKNNFWQINKLRVSLAGPYPVHVRGCFGFNLAMTYQSSHLVPCLTFFSSAFCLSDRSATFFHYCYSLININFSPLSWGGSSCTRLLDLACVNDYSELKWLFWSEYRVVTPWEDSAATEHRGHGIHSQRAIAEPIQRFASLRAGFCSFYWW